MKNFLISKITHQNNTAGEKNNLGLMSDLFTWNQNHQMSLENKFNKG